MNTIQSKNFKKKVIKKNNLKSIILNNPKQ